MSVVCRAEGVVNFLTKQAEMLKNDILHHSQKMPNPNSSYMSSSNSVPQSIKTKSQYSTQDNFQITVIMKSVFFGQGTERIVHRTSVKVLMNPPNTELIKAIAEHLSHEKIIEGSDSNPSERSLFNSILINNNRV